MSQTSNPPPPAKKNPNKKPASKQQTRQKRKLKTPSYQVLFTNIANDKLIKKKGN